MRISYDPEVDALSIVFRETTVTTQPLADGIAADYDQQGRLAGLEILDALKRFGDRETLRQIVLEGIVPAPAVLRERPPEYGSQSASRAPT
jgi:uncharacterized protein YuzE